jgi:hypothetical protein
MGHDIISINIKAFTLQKFSYFLNIIHNTPIGAPLNDAGKIAYELKTGILK